MINVKPFKLENLKLVAKGGSLPVIEIVPGQIITKKRIMKISIKDGAAVPDTENDILKLVVAFLICIIC